VGAIGNLERIALLFAAAAVVFQCFVPPTVGLADNGDFPKIAGQLDVGNPLFSKDVVRFADLKYVVDSKYHWNSQFYSSELLLFAAAFGLDSIRGKPETFDLRLLGAIHAAIFLLAFYRLLPLLNSLRPALRMVLLCLILLFFTDVMYVAYFNSFFIDTGALLFLLLAVVSFLRALRWQKPLDRWLFVASSMLLVTSKTQHFLLGIPIAMLLACKGGLLTRGRGWAFRTFSAIAVLAAIAFSNRFGAPAHYPTMGSYTVIFFELLPKSKDVSSDLKELGLDDSYKHTSAPMLTPPVPPCRIRSAEKSSSSKCPTLISRASLSSIHSEPWRPLFSAWAMQECNVPTLGITIRRLGSPNMPRLVLSQSGADSRLASSAAAALGTSFIRYS